MSKQYSGGKNSLFNKNFKTRFSSIAPRLNKIEDALQTIMLNVLSATDKSNAYWSTIRKDISNNYMAMNVIYAKWAKSEIPRIYSGSILRQMKHINKLKSVTNVAKVSATALASNRASAMIMRTLYEDAIRGFLTSTEVGKTNMLRLTRATQQSLINEGLIDITVAQGFEKGNLGRSISMLNAEFKKALIVAVHEKQFVQAGKFKYKPSYYAQMVSRVKFHEAQAQATLATASNYGTDLVIISSHNTTTEICLPFEGKIFSISGNDPRFPVLTWYPPFHPNCLHLIYPQFESSLKLSGTLDAYSDFSLGKTNAPPTPAGFIPLNKRGVA